MIDYAFFFVSRFVAVAVAVVVVDDAVLRQRFSRYFLCAFDEHLRK